ncbi:MAG TPA: zinc metalloprotease HtpX [Nitrospiraceae bacterium]|nr:zinc metalloprotease HtpX [Nitrospiraceae bacterium]
MNTLKTTFFLAILAVLFVAIGSLLGGKNGATMALIMAGVMNLGAYWFSDKIVLAMYRAKEVAERDAPELHSIVRQLTVRAQLPMPRVYMMDNPTPNAFATGRNPEHAAVAVTTGILNLLSREELSGVIGHELAHIKNRDILISTIAATIAGAISYLAHMAQWGLMFGGRRDNEDRNPLGSVIGIFIMILAPIAAMLIQMAISRSREYKADESGATVCGNPLALASALKKLQTGVRRIPMQANPSTAHMFIVSPLTGGGMLSLFSTHPPIEERIARLEAMSARR